MIRDLGMKDDFAGTVNLQTGELVMISHTISPSANRHLQQSVSGVLVDTDNSVIAAGSLLIQMLPDAIEEDI